MPKGETSRPLNATERKALKTLLKVRKDMEGLSVGSKSYLIQKSGYSKAIKTLYDADKKQAVRSLSKTAAEKLGPSNVPSRKAVKKVIGQSTPSQVRLLARKK